MGLFNGLSSIGEINGLLRDFENQVTISQAQVESGAPRATLESSLNVMKSIHQRLIDLFTNSAMARTAMFTVFGDKMQMHGILTYTKNVIYHLYAIASSR